MSNDGVNAGRRRFLVAATSVVGAAGAVGAAVPFVGSWFPSAKAKAAGAPVKVNIARSSQASRWWLNGAVSRSSSCAERRKSSAI
jgi:Rieske Fe-S protein